MYEIVEQYGFTATHQIHGLPLDHVCAGVHPHRWVAEFVLSAPKLLPTDGPSEHVIMEPVRKYVTTALEGKHLNDLLAGAPTPARLAWHLAAWCQGHLAVYATASLTSVFVSSGPASRVRYTVPRAPSCCPA